MIRGIYSEINIIPPATGLVSGEITGYHVTSSGVSGVVGTPLYTSGSRTSSGFYTYTSGVALTGAVGMSGIVNVPQRRISRLEGTNQIDEDVYKRVTNLTIVFFYYWTATAFYSCGLYV